MNANVIVWHDTFNIKRCPYELLFGNFYDQPIPTEYYDFLKDNNDDENNIPGTPVEKFLPDNEGV